MNPIKIPARVDEPPHLLLWSVDELAPMMLGLVVGIMLEQALVCCLIGFFVTKAYRKFRDNSPDGYLLHMLYHWGVFPLKGRSLLNPFIKRLFP